MNSLEHGWPEPVVRVQSLSESGIRVIPHRYVKPQADRPCPIFVPGEVNTNIPVIDLQGLYSSELERSRTLGLISEACKEWGFFQVVNHGVSHELMRRTREVWRQFFKLPMELKQAYANSPATYEGYGSRLGVVKGAKLDWSDYFFLHYFPLESRDTNKWPTLPPSCRKVIEEYGEESVKVCEKLMRILSVNLGLGEKYLEEAFGGDEIGVNLRVNFYPKCPQPDLTLGLSPHSDPGCLTLLLPDDDVSGLQVRKGNSWLTVKPVPNAFIVNIGDQIQVLSNSMYKSVEHRVIVNSAKERVSLALFYNPQGDIAIEPAKELLTEGQPALYQPMTFNQYRSFIRTRGPCGKSQVNSLISPR